LCPPTRLYYIFYPQAKENSSKTLITNKCDNLYPEDKHNNSLRNFGSHQTHNRASCTPKIWGPGVSRTRT